tara:strand:+ start:2904 stop:3248 length:345 start_codon:yes stop_codon:yes gene_type:complete
MSGNTFRVPYLNGKIRLGVWVIWLLSIIIQIGDFNDDDVILANLIITGILVVITLWYQFELYMGYNLGWFAWLLKDDRIVETNTKPPLTSRLETQTHITNITLNDSVYVEDKKN